MTLADVKTMLDGMTGFKDKVGYRSFPVGQAPPLPFVVYLVKESDNFKADNVVYYPQTNIDIELYSKYKDVASETIIESTLDSNGIVWSKYEQYIDSEEVYEMVYSITI